ncbi:hypothetical protein A4X09_0g7243 [Tilletia walkeri]|uniref:Retrotransposon gag domain-containing protein n=1 Tax=Tilletia walkeri TaxID=117179 RepID=A0A8X7N3V4_9BASI|nr:hypothetical protein A4X09_0g7243 [Tilletia walkeri]
MAPKPDPATASSATTRSQAKRDTDETASGPVTKSPESGGEDSWTDILSKILRGQDKLGEKIDALEGHRTDTSNQIEELTSRMSRVELSSQSESVPSVAPLTSSRPTSDDVRLNPIGDAQPTAPLATDRTTAELPASLSDFLATMTSDDQSAMRNLLGKYGRKSVSKLDSAATVPSGDSAAAVTPPPPIVSVAAPSPVGNRSLVCKKDVLGEFDGNPSKLEVFLGRVQTITRSNPDPYWEPAVICCLPQRLVGDAQVWHVGLSKADSEKLTTVAEWCRIMRRRFPVNKIEQRQQAHARAWKPVQETSMTYFFNKVQLFRHAYGDMFTDEALAQQVISGLPASMRALLRLPQEGTSLEEVQDGLCDWEPSWRETSNTPLEKTSPESKESAKSGSETAVTAKALTAPPARPPRSDQRLMAPLAKPVAPASSPPVPTISASVAPLSESYDPSRVIEAAGGQPRMYRRPDSSRVMKIARNCAKCGSQHFDFEHDYLQRSGQIRNMAPLTDDYPEVEEEELGLAPF